jgi:hypothetical protein
MKTSITDDNITDPEENPTANGHLPVSGEVGGPIAYHDPLTTDTNDDPDDDPIVEASARPKDMDDEELEEE